MAIKFEMDLSSLHDAIQHAPKVAGEAAVKGLDSIKDDWVMEARDIAPLDSGNLRKQIKGKVNPDGLESNVMVTGNAVNHTSGYGRFNYGYYLHELQAEGKKLQTPGTEYEFLDKSVDESRWQTILEGRILSALGKIGWSK
ncbi:hypothetical protein [Paenisporosarcina sp. NPDC076898]|uniref:hypothetical protein n=1 Tax=unclassified Paenisporosarcina TaxID=2642018 RepID=UPI003D0508ED